jgi:hypothetical protein
MNKKLTLDLKSISDEVSISDGYHTFDELYDHRIILYTALCKNINEVLILENPGKFEIWKSQKHSDGTNIDGWFVLGIGTDKGKQITYHLPNEKWNKCNFAVALEKAPEFDGHTSEDVLKRISNL